MHKSVYAWHFIFKYNRTAFVTVPQEESETEGLTGNPFRFSIRGPARNRTWI
jgi:hypothetical protein